MAAKGPPVSGPLTGFRVIELAGIGPGPMAGMLLADMGADVVRVERSRSRNPLADQDASFRGKKSLALDLKQPAGREVLLRLVERSDAIIEGFRPGVVERLGIGPEECLARNPRLVYGRITGWGRDGPLAHSAGHDINYIALTGALYSTGRDRQPPTVPLNLVGDMGGGGMLLAFGVVCALLHARIHGKGQVVDAAMVDGAALLMWMMQSWHARGEWNADARGVNLLDGGAPFYDVYQTLDGGYVCIGPLENEFYLLLLDKLGLDRDRFGRQYDRDRWPELRSELTRAFASRTRAEWQALLEGTDACFAPVLSMAEAPAHPHNLYRRTYASVDGVMQPSPAPRFSVTPPAIRHGTRAPGQDNETVLGEAGFSAEEIEALVVARVLV